MGTEKTKATESTPPTVVRLDAETRAQLVKLAELNGRSLSKEIIVRLLASLNAKQTGLPHIGHDVVGTRETPTEYKTSAEVTTTERAMLLVFRSLPPEKQLALLSLFK